MSLKQDRDVAALSAGAMENAQRDASKRGSSQALSFGDGCVGAIERVEGGKVFGWVYFGDQAVTVGASEVGLLDGTEKIAVFVPNRGRADIRDVGFDAGGFGFAVELPTHLFDGADHNLCLCRSVDDKPIAGSKKRLKLIPELAATGNKRIRGQFMGVRGILAEGWACDANDLDEPVTIEILDGDQVIARGVANVFRGESEEQFDGGTYSGFRIRLPDEYLDGRRLDLIARDAVTTAYLPNDGPTLVTRVEHPGYFATINDIEDQSLIGLIEMDAAASAQDAELELWIDGIWADRFTIALPGSDGTVPPLRLLLPESVREGDTWTSVFDGDVHEFVLTVAETSLILAARHCSTALKTYSYSALKRDHSVAFGRLPRFVRQLVSRIADSALFDARFYSHKVCEEFASERDAILHYLSDRKHWRHPTSLWLDVSFVNKLAGQLTRDLTSPLEWYVRQGATSDVGPNPLFSNADYCIFTRQEKDARPSGTSFFDDWLKLISETTSAPNPSALIDLNFVRTTTIEKPDCTGEQVLGYLTSWLQQDSKTRGIETLSPYFDQDWLEQCFILKHNKPAGCLLSAFRLGLMTDQSPHPVLQCSRQGKDYYALLRGYELLYFSSGIDDLSRLSSSIDADAFYAQFPHKPIATGNDELCRSSLYRYLTADTKVVRQSFMRGLDDEFIENEYQGLIKYCLAKRGIADINRIWTRWVRLLGVPGSYHGSVDKESGLLTIQNIRELRFHKSQAQEGDVQASFIIPTYARDDLVIRCMLSALQSGNVNRIEFIVAEDAAHVDSGWILGYFLPYASIYQNPKNLGFLLSCKEAVSRSSGPVFLLVNNDVIVHADAIDQMLTTFEHREDAAVVGGLVLNVDGSIQENGGILWNDASAWNYHRNWKTEDEFALNVRQADYVSGCWIGIRREAWDRIGGFDTRYVPAYYEETDFCLSCWRYGYRVYVNPLSEITHLDGATMGQDEDNSSTLKSFQKINRNKLLEKWKLLLSAVYNESGNPTPFHTGRNDHKRFVTVVFDHYIPEPDRDAGSRAIDVVCQALSRMEDNYVLFIPANNHRSKYAASLERLGIEIVTGAEGWKRFDHLLANHGEMIRHVFVSRIEVAKKFEWHINKLNCAKSIYIHDIDALRGFQHDMEASGYEELVKEAVSQYAAENESVFAMFDYIVSLSEDETRLLKPYFGRKLVDIFPYDFEPIKEGESINERKDVLFVGSYNHLPNREAITNFVENIWPGVLEELPKACLHLCGSGFESANSLCGRSVVLHGMVTDETLAYLYSISRVSIAPLLSGAGMKGKVIESCSRGVPCVGTEVAWQGIGLPAEYAFLSGTISSFRERLTRAYHAHSKNTVEELVELYETWRGKNKVADVIPRLVKFQVLS